MRRPTHRLHPVSVLVGLAVATLAPSALADETFTLDGTVVEGDPEHVFVDFEVPAGVAEIQVEHDDQSEDDILDWGLYDPNGFRGWGGGNTEPIVITEDAASRSYLAGPLPAGTWRLVVGKAKLDDDGGTYHAVVTLRDAATLAPQPERSPYVAPEPLETAERWYQGDFHVHSRESGDAKATIDEIIAFSREHGMDFVELSDHNTTSHLDFMNDAQSRSSDVLLLPGVEYTTYAGHANGIGATKFVDHKIGVEGATIAGAVDAFHEMGALFSINHPTLDLGEVCIGCAWKHEIDPKKVDAVEIATAGSASIFMEATLKFWESLCEDGHHVAALGGSDDHRAGQDLGAFGAPIGVPRTMVFADELSVEGILEGIRAGRTVVKVRGPDDPMIEMGKGSSGPWGVSVSARVTGGKAKQARWVVNGENKEFVDIGSDDEEFVLEVAPPPEGKSNRYRLEVWEGTLPVSFASHVWVEAADGGVEPLGGGIDCAVSAADVGVRNKDRRPAWTSALALSIAFMIIARRSSRSGEKR